MSWDKDYVNPIGQHVQHQELGGAGMTVRSLFFIVQVAVALLSLAAATPATAAEPIRIGFMAPLSGLFAQAGKDMLDGLRLGLEEAGFQAGGRRIEVVTEDGEGNNSTPGAEYPKLVEDDPGPVFTRGLPRNISYWLVPII